MNRTTLGRFALCSFVAAAAVFTSVDRAHAAPLPVLGGLELHLDASSIVAANGAPITTWSDLSGNGNHATMDVGANTNYIASGLNGAPVVRFDGTDIMQTTTGFASTPYTILTVSQMEGTQNQRLISSSTNNWLMGYWGGGADKMFVNPSWEYQGIAAPGTSPRVYTASGSGSNTAFYSDGAKLADDPSSATAIGNLSLGGWGVSNAETSKGDVAEVIVYNRELSRQELEDVNLYLNEKYSLTTAYSDDNVALHRPIVDGSGAWNQRAYDDNTDGFAAWHVTDGADSETRVSSPSNATYWLGKNNDVTEFFTLDLEQVRDVNTISLANTHNDGSNDRGTRDFRVLGSTNGVDFTEILASTLTTHRGSNGNTIIPKDVFTKANGLAAGQYRYLKFETLSASNSNNQVGLNEIRVYETTKAANVAAGKPIVDGSGAWTDGAGNSTDYTAGIFQASSVTDQRIDDIGPGTPGYDNFGDASYWLGRENFAGEYFVVDLQGQFKISGIDLQNTHNRNSNDRGTADFNIQYSLDGITWNSLFSDTLSNVAGTGFDIPIESFSVENGDFSAFHASFIRFEAETFYGRSAGLSEIWVLGHLTPEPSSFALFVIGMLGMGVWRRRRARR